MGFNLNGYILRPARVAGGNSPDSDEATTGVDRDHITPDSLDVLGYVALPDKPVEPYADMYRAAVLLKPSDRTSTEEYCVFAATTSSLSVLDEGDSVLIEGGSSTTTPLTGTLTVTGSGGPYEDGTAAFRLLDPGGRDISAIQYMGILSPDLGLIEVKAGEAIGFDDTLSDLSVGTVVLNAGALTALGGGFSPERGDIIVSVYYILSPPTYWWTRNDQDLTRFGWDGMNQRWSPLPGTLPRDMGSVIPEETYKLAPPPTRFSIDDILPYPATSDGYALIRVGLYPDSLSTPLRIQVKADSAVEAGWDPFGEGWDSTLDGVVGVTNGILRLNPATAKVNDVAGRTLWYNPESFPVQGESDGNIGPIKGLPSTSNQGFPVLSPTPGLTDRPLVRIGFRRYLTPIPVDTDEDLPTPTSASSSGVAPPTEGQFCWSRTTGKIVLSNVDIKKCTPGSGTYQLPYLNASLYYDGVVMCQEPLPVKAPVAALDETGTPIDGTAATTPVLGKIWVPRSVCLPAPGVSGVKWVPDGSGDTPDLSSAPTPQTRPVGNGLMREVGGIGDAFFFTSGFAFEKLDIDEYDDDLPELPFKVAKNKAAVSRMAAGTQPASTSNASLVQCRRKQLIDGPLYFRQCEVIPSVYMNEARIYSRFAGPYLIGSCKIRFALDGDAYEWDSLTLNPTGAETSFTASELATSIQNDTTPALPAGSVGVAQERIYLEAENPSDGVVEIGWNTTQTNLTGHAALGLLPGWRIDTHTAGGFNWLPDNGASMGVFRSPLNRNRRSSTPDVRSRDKMEDTVLVDGIFANPFVRVNPPPLEDIPGYGENSHFQTSIGLLKVDLENYVTTLDVGVKYDWANQRLIWTESASTNPTKVPYPNANLQLSHTGILSETVSSAAMLDTDYGFYLKEPDDPLYVEQDLGETFLMPGDALPGQTQLIEIEGGIVARGGGGSTGPGFDQFYDGNVADQDGLFSSVEPGYLLHVLNGGAQGVYQITGKNQPGGPGSVVFFDITPPMPSGISTQMAQWRIYEAELRSASVVDQTLVADVQLVGTNHLPSEPFKIRLLSSAGSVVASGPPGTLTADVVDALASGRVVSLRFGVDPIPANSRTVTYLERGVMLGGVAETGLIVPDTSDPHFIESLVGSPAYFSLRVGSVEYSTTAGNLSMVGSVPSSVPPGQIQVVAYGLGADRGKIYIASDVVATQGGDSVYYDQVFSAMGDIPADTVQLDPSTGFIQISETDSLLFAGTTAYFVEQMVTEGELDVTTSPMSGSIFFNKPLREGQIVETSYYEADSSGDKKLDEDGNAVEITEFLPLIVRLEEATPSETDANVFTYNPTGRTVSSTVEPFVWVGVELMNFAGKETATIEADPARITLFSTPEEGSVVKINYGVLEAFGGEVSYTVSTPPVYRKPFFMEKEQTEFVLQTDRRSSFPTGHLMVLGSTPMYVVSSTYLDTVDLTTVTIWPPPLTSIGSRAVGRDARLAVSDFPVAITIDPAGTATPGGGSPGFLATLDTAATPLLPCDKGQLEVAFYGDVTKWMRPNHLLEIDGYPYVVLTSSMSGDGRNTKVQLGTPLYTKSAASPVVRISTRPVYGPDPFEFAPVYPLVPEESFSLFLMGSVDSAGTQLPGRELVEGLDYTLTKPDGKIMFQRPTQPPLQAGEFLHLRYTRLRETSPVVQDEAILYPLYKGGYLHITTPSEENRLLGGVLRAQYSYRNPDSFYFSVETLAEYLGEVATISASKGGSSPGAGPMLAFPGSPDPKKQGTYGLRGDTADLGDQDRAARVYVEFFNEVIVAFEQVLEALDGRIIGDRDGKFRFFIGHNKRYAPPGWEDEITGDLNRRLIWREIIENWAPAAYENNNGFFLEADPIYNPITAEVPEPGDRPGDTTGENLDPDLRKFFIQRQKSRIKNDMDDRILVGTRRPRGLPFFLFPIFQAKGRYKDMWQDHFFSRLFPETTNHFSRLMPGLEAVEGPNGYTDPGFYSFGREITKPGPEPGEETEQVVRTRGTTIGTVSNPALGEIPNIVDISAQPRQPRARMWAYFPKGSSKLDSALSLTTSTVGTATIVATPLPLSEFPLDPTNGFPDISQLLYETPTGSPSTGTLDSLDTGNIALSTPAFEQGQRVSYGQPNGRTYSLTDGSGYGICVGKVQKGCVITLASCQDPTTSVTGSDVYVIPLSVTLDEVVSDETGYGDTVYVVPTVGDLDLEGLASSLDASDMEQRAKLAEVLPDYRIQFDLKVRRKRGEFVDGSLPTEEDVFPFDFQSWFGQKPPPPLSCIEGTVDFNNTESEPAQLPCLLGQGYDDSGDNQLPYMKSFSELDVLAQVAVLLPVLFDDNTSETLPYQPNAFSANEQQNWAAVYPDEIVVTDGQIAVESSFLGAYPYDAAALYTGANLRPVEDAGTYTPNSGVGDLRLYDLLFVETKQPSSAAGGGDLWNGATGILSVGYVSETLSPGGETVNQLEVPRFVCSIPDGGRHYYTLRSFAGNVEQVSGDLGFTITHSDSGPIRRYILDFSDVSDLDFSGLATLLNNGPGSMNACVLRIYSDDQGLPSNPFIGSITFMGVAAGVGYVIVYSAAAGVVTPIPLGGIGLVVGTNQLDFEVASATSTIESLLSISSAWHYDFTMDIDTHIDSITAAVSGAAPGSGFGSTTCKILRDRLTFREGLYFNKALPRDALPANGWTEADGYVTGQIPLETALAVHRAEIGTIPESSINDPDSVNKGDYFTFLPRFGPATYGSVTPGQLFVGSNDSATGRGYLTTMSWEGHGNTPLADKTENIVLAAAPSSDLGVDDVILESSGKILDGDSDVAPVSTGVGSSVYEGNRNYIINLAAAPAAGATANVVPGDIVVIDSVVGGGTTSGAIKCGTYLARYAMPTTAWSEETDGGGFGGGVLSPMGTVPITPVFTSLAAALGVPSAQALTKNSPTSDTGCLNLTFPYILSADEGTNTVVLGNVVPVAGTIFGHGWRNGDYLNLVLKEKYATYSTDADGAGNEGWVLDKDAVWRLAISGIGTYDAEALTLVLQMGAGAVEDAAGALSPSPPTLSDFYAAAVPGTVCSGMAHLAVQQMAEYLPSNNVFGADSVWDGASLTYAYGGWARMQIKNMNPAISQQVTDAGGTWDGWDVVTSPAGYGLINSVGSGTTTGHILAVTPPVKDNVDFYSNPAEPVYGRVYYPAATNRIGVAGVTTHLSMSEVTGEDGIFTGNPGLWYAMHFYGLDSGGVSPLQVYLPDNTNVPTPNILCLMPGDRFSVGDNIEPTLSTESGFWAVEGVFLEPSFPRPTQDLSAVTARVVCADNSVGSVDEIGIRDAATYNGGAADYEEIRFFVRRIRRWHEQQEAVVEAVSPLRYLYETRRGVMASYDTSTRVVTADPAVFGTATQLGDFTHPLLNVNAGDVFRVVSATDGRLLDTAEIQKVEGGTTLKLRRPGLDPSLFAANDAFEIYLSQPMVPQEQSNDQLLAMVTSEELYRRVPDYAGGSTVGGSVAKQNELEDTDVGSWATVGVAEDDYVVIDPAGPLYIAPEMGMRPKGDTACEARASVYEMGGPFGTDDNRGFYKVTGVDKNNSGDDAPGILLVDGECKFTNSGTPFGAATAEYVVLPTVHGSQLSASGAEPQQMLRETAAAVSTPEGLSFAARSVGSTGDDGYKSIEPFGFRVIRPNPIFSSDAVELILFMRERLLSWAEELRAIQMDAGNYYIFQKEDHIEDVGDATGMGGLGLISNSALLSLSGLVSTTPFANTDDCLSVLDRRFWILDFRLDIDGYTDFAGDTLTQRPVLPDYIEDVLDLSDLFREQRFGWISFRANRQDGSIQAAKRAVSSLGRRLAKARRALARQRALDKS